MSFIVRHLTWFACALSAGCATYSESPDELAKRVNDQWAAVQNARATDPSDLADARVEVEDALAVLSSGGFPKDYSVYANDLGPTLDSMAKSSRVTLDLDAYTGLPHGFYRRLEAWVQAQEELARIAIRLGEPARALEVCKIAQRGLRVAGPVESLKLVHKVSLHKLEAEAADALGAKGQAHVARVQADLLGDLLASDDGAALFYAELAATRGEQAKTMWRMVDEHVSNVNDEREAKAAATRAAVVGVVQAGLQAAAAADQRASTSPAAQAALVQEKFAGALVQIASAMDSKHPSLGSFVASFGGISVTSRLLSPAGNASFERMLKFFDATAGLDASLGSTAVDLARQLARIRSDYSERSGDVDANEVARFVTTLGGYLDEVAKR